MRVTVLGCGSSSGTPSVEFGWGVCDPANPKNQRLRPSILVEEGETRILVDTSPDLRRQLLDHEIQALDGVLLTHAHSDHLHGIDDLRGVNRRMNAAIPFYSDAATLETVTSRFAYVFEPLAEDATFYYKATLTPHTVSPGETFDVATIPVTAIAQDHGYVSTLGFRFGDFAYSTDLVSMNDQAFELLKGVKVWMLGAFTDKPHPTHLDVDRALEWIERVKPQRAVFTHMGSNLDYETLKSSLPDHIVPAFDGLIVDV